MDDKALEVSRKKLAGLDRQLSDLAIKQRRVEKQLADEQDLIRKAAAQRVGVVSQLVDAAPEQAAKVHKQLDSLDSQIRGSERMAESFQALLRTLAGELADVTVEHDRVNRIVGDEINSRAFASWQTEMEANFKAATAAMEQARLTLGRLTVAAAIGVEKFRGLASNWVTAEFDRFEHVEHNADTIGGYKMATPWFRNTNVVIWPMEKR